MLSSIEIKDCPPFKHIFLNDLKKINIIGGKNNVGKSQLINRIDLVDYKKEDFTLSSLEPEIQGEAKLIWEFSTKKPIKFIGEIRNYIFFTHILAKKEFPYALKKTSFILNEFFQSVSPSFEMIYKKFECPHISIKFHESGFEHEIGSMGSGFIWLFTILIKIFLNPCSVILIDDIHKGLHPGFFKKLFVVLNEICNENNNQIICTTHSSKCVEAAYEAYEDYEKIPDNMTFFRLDYLKKHKDIGIVRCYQEDIGNFIQFETDCC